MTAADPAAALLVATEAELYQLGQDLHDEAFQATIAAGLLLDQAKRAAQTGDVQRAMTLVQRARGSVSQAQEVILAVSLRSGVSLGGERDLERSIHARLRLAGLDQRVRFASRLAIDEVPQPLIPMLHRMIWWLIQRAAGRTGGAIVLSTGCRDETHVVVSVEEDVPGTTIDNDDWASARAEIAGGSVTRVVRDERLTTTLEIPIR
jgi:hypothetical protein